ncbi:hypothetical protein FACS1894125_6360 [Actinomycetota bacterium]|nr:hypothetical protein FACS1894125_6360 [Actinomycetota bacterium]
MGYNQSKVEDIRNNSQKIDYHYDSPMNYILYDSLDELKNISSTSQEALVGHYGDELRRKILDILTDVQKLIDVETHIRNAIMYSDAYGYHSQGSLNDAIDAIKNFEWAKLAWDGVGDDLKRATTGWNIDINGKSIDLGGNDGDYKDHIFESDSSKRERTCEEIYHEYASVASRTSTALYSSATDCQIDKLNIDSGYDESNDYINTQGKLVGNTQGQTGNTTIPVPPPSPPPMPTIQTCPICGGPFPCHMHDKVEPEVIEICSFCHMRIYPGYPHNHSESNVGNVCPRCHHVLIPGVEHRCLNWPDPSPDPTDVQDPQQSDDSTSTSADSSMAGYSSTSLSGTSGASSGSLSAGSVAAGLSGAAGVGLGAAKGAGMFGATGTPTASTSQATTGMAGARAGTRGLAGSSSGSSAGGKSGMMMGGGAQGAQGGDKEKKRRSGLGYASPEIHTDDFVPYIRGEGAGAGSRKGR